MWIFFAAGSALFAGATAILAKCGIRKTDSTVATAIRTIVVLVFAWIMVLVAGSQDQLGSLGGTTLLFLILSGMESTITTNSTSTWDRYFGLCDGSILSLRVAFSDTGFTVYARGGSRQNFPDFTDSGRTYCYIAFR